jgi:hypothetical protein
MRKTLIAAAAVLGAVAVSLPSTASANPVCDAWAFVQKQTGRDIAYCIDDPSALDDLLTLEP